MRSFLPLFHYMRDMKKKIICWTRNVLINVDCLLFCRRSIGLRVSNFHHSKWFFQTQTSDSIQLTHTRHLQSPRPISFHSTRKKIIQKHHSIQHHPIQLCITQNSCRNNIFSKQFNSTLCNACPSPITLLFGVLCARRSEQFIFTIDCKVKKKICIFSLNNSAPHFFFFFFFFLLLSRLCVFGSGRHTNLSVPNCTLDMISFRVRHIHLGCELDTDTQITHSHTMEMNDVMMKMMVFNCCCWTNYRKALVNGVRARKREWNRKS